ncbi:hypothetical protein EMCG_03939 [[Emmonsia] crescens]|uniref:Uncharacterized protein n=1 Tax=[Emmonsia] crescens TaxID=73230 RepID=A0A0G2J811_9EURO|nr:hypothetical protein EMCG_03939 [Emmonsia crescens UAMH 3008]
MFRFRRFGRSRQFRQFRQFSLIKRFSNSHRSKLFKMKLSFVGLVALLATAATSTPVEASTVDVAAADWKCFQQTGGAGHAQLKKLHKEFNRLFGAARLRVAAGQCYTAQCNGQYFGLCTGDVYGQVEIANHRNIAAAANPESGRQCVIFLGDDNLRYRYDSAPIYGRYKTDLRNC